MTFTQTYKTVVVPDIAAYVEMQIAMLDRVNVLTARRDMAVKEWPTNSEYAERANADLHSAVSALSAILYASDSPAA